MAVIDDEFLGTLFHEAASSFEVPESGIDDILRRAASREKDVDAAAPDGDDLGDGAEDGAVTTFSGRVRQLRRSVGSHRVMATAAAAVVVLAVLGTTLALSGSNTPRNPRLASPAVAGGTPDLAPTTTTSPGLDQKSASSPHGSAAFGVNGTSGAGAAGAPPTALGAVSAPPAAAAGTTSSGSSGSTVQTLPSGSVGQSARIEQTGSLNLVVAKGTLTTTMAKLANLATVYGGFVANSQTQSGAFGGGPSGTVTLQIPVASFSAALKTAQSLGRTTSLSTKATDVTGQYVDLQSQITALQASRQQYLTIMARATSIGDVLSVQEQLDSIDTQIQQLQGQLNVLNSETSYSTLNVQVSEKAIVRHHTTPRRPSGLDKAWHDSLHGFASAFDGLVGGIGPALFALLCLAVVLVGGRLGWRRYQRHRL